MRGGRTPSEVRTDLPALRELLLLATIALISVERDLTIWSVSTGAVGNYHLRVGMSAFHIPLAALVLLSVVDFARSPHRPRGVFAALISGTAVWIGVCFVLAPTWRGVDVLIHLLAAWAIWDTIHSGDRDRHRRLLVAVCALGGLQACLALAQRLIGGNLGIDSLEASGEFYRFGPVVAVRGSLVHQYHFVTLMMVCAAAAFVLLQAGVGRNARRLLIAELIILGAVVPMTFSRAVVLAIVPMVVVLLLEFRERLGVPTAMWIAGLVAGAIASIDGVTGRASASVSGERRFDSGRTERLREAVDLVRDHPVTGVGPGNYVAELQRDLGLVGDPSVKVLPPHNVVAQLAAETGIVGGLLALVLLGALAVWTVRGGGLRLVVVLAMPPFLMLDLFPYTWQLGIVITAIWLAIADMAPGMDPRERSRPSTRTGASSQPVPENR